LDEVSFVINTNDWKYVGNTCYFTVFFSNLNYLFPDISLKDEFSFSEADMTKLQLTLPEYPDFLPFLKNQISLSSRNYNQNKVSLQYSFWSQSEEDLSLTSSIPLANAHLTQNKQKLSQLKYLRHQLFNEIYQSIDGSRLSFKDRHYNYKSLTNLYDNHSVTGDLLSSFGVENLNRSNLRLQPHHGGNFIPATVLANNYVDDMTLSYSEIEIFEFDQFLYEIGAVDGQIFYDLGCGVGKALIGAMLSGVRFLKLIGIELLPSLATCCNDIIKNLLLEYETTQNTLQNASLIAASTDSITSPAKKVVDFTLENSFARTKFSSDTNDSEESDFDLLRGNNSTDSQDLQETNSDAKDRSYQKDSDIMSQSSLSYRVNAIPKLKEKLRKAQVSIPIFEIR
jgi:hypothetical protein